MDGAIKLKEYSPTDLRLNNLRISFEDHRVLGVWHVQSKAERYSDAYFHQSRVKDQFKSQKTNCFNPHQDLCPIEITVLVVSCPIVLMMPQTGLLLFAQQIQASVQHKRPRCWQVHPDHLGTMFWLKQAATYSAQSKCIMLCGLYGWTKNRLMIRNHSTLTVPGLLVADVNFSFSCFVHNGFCFCNWVQVWCSAVCVIRTRCIDFWSPGRFVLEDARKMCNTGLNPNITSSNSISFSLHT